MESAEGPIKRQKLRINHVVYTEVVKVEEIKGTWYVHFDGSRESIGFGGEKPYEVGDKIKMTFEKVDHA